MSVLVAPTPRDVIHRDGTAQVYRFRGEVAGDPLPLLVVPSMINRWYVVDLRSGASIVEALVAGGHHTFCLDWGIPHDEDRYLTWDEVVDRLGRAVRAVCRFTGKDRVGVLGYCMGSTLAGIYTALSPERVAAFVNLAGPFDFSEAGLLGTMTDARWFDPEAITAPGNLAPLQMQSGFISLRPTAQISKWIRLAENIADPRARESFEALETWVGDNIPFPAAAYVTYIRELYQENRLVQGTHFVKGRRVDLGAIRCPVLTVATCEDTICPLKAAEALNEHVGSEVRELHVVPGGHVGAVIGSRARRELYPRMVSFFREHLDPLKPAKEAAPPARR